MGSAPQTGSGYRRGCEWGLHLREGVDTGEGCEWGLHHKQEVDTGEGMNGVCTTDREWTQERV